MTEEDVKDIKSIINNCKNLILDSKTSPELLKDAILGRLNFVLTILSDNEEDD